jgi:transposase
VYTPIPKKHGYSEEEKNLAIKYYYEGNSGRSTGRFFKMSKANAVRWIKERAEKEKELPQTPTERCEAEELDEMYVYIGSKKTKPM